MAHDPAWDMPKQNWQQQGSFVVPGIPPDYEPDEGPLVCLPQINQFWLHFVMGAIDQLRNPSSWLVADDDAMSTTLYRVSRLKQMIGAPGDCMSLAIRFDGDSCQLQQSIDSGSTWTEVDGWGDFSACLPPQTQLSYDDGCTLSESFDGGASFTAVPGWVDNFSGCVQKYTPIIGLPPNPGDQEPDQLACSIATYLAEQVIVAAMGKAVTAISDDLTLLQFGLDVVNIIPEFVLVTLAADAFSAIYVAVQEGTLGDFEDALTDSTLLLNVKCAIYGCIVGEGYVKPDNFDCITAAIAAISYSHSDVIDAIGTYLTALGPTGLAQLSQVAGLEAGADCSTCGEWCFMWDTSGDFGDLEDWATGVNAYDPAKGITSVGIAGDQILQASLTFDETFLKWFTFTFTRNVGANGGASVWKLCPPSDTCSLETAQSAAGTHTDGNEVVNGNATGAAMELDSSQVGNTGDTWISSITIKGTGTCPFGDPNCTP